MQRPTYKLWQRLQTELYAQELTDVFSLESKLFPCLVDMRFKGVRVDIDKAHKIKNTLIQREKTILQNIKKLNKCRCRDMGCSFYCKSI